MLEFFKNLKPKTTSLEMRKGVKPIIASIIDASYHIDEITEKTIAEIKQNGVNIDFFANGEERYLISEINNSSKYSSDFRNCTGIIIVGKNKNGEEVSFMTHQDPSGFLGDKKDNFIFDLSEKTKEILQNVDRNNIDAVVFGGNDRIPKFREYKDSINLISTVLKRELGFEPTVMTGPDMRSGADVFFETKNRRLYILRRSYISEANEAYMPSNFKKQSKKWKI